MQQTKQASMKPSYKNSGENIVEDYFHEFLSFHPLFASYIGYREYDGNLVNSYSKDYVAKIQYFYQKYLKQLEACKNKTLYHRVLEYNLKNNLQYYTFPFFTMALSMNGIIFQTLHSMVCNDVVPLRSKHDLENLIRRYEQAILIVRTQRGVLEEGISKKITVPKLIVRIVIARLKSLEKRKFELPKNKTKLKAEARAQYELLIDKKICPEVINFRRFLESTYLPAARASIGLCGLPNGKKMYTYLVRTQTTLPSITVKEIFDFGQKEVSRIESEMNLIMHEIGYKGSQLSSFLKKIYKEKKFLYSSGKELIKAFRQYHRKIRTSVLPRYFHFDVSSDYEIREVPKQKAKYSTGAYYILPSIKTGKKGCFYINTYHSTSNPSFLLESLLLHEGNPGHHFQNMRAIDLKLPKFLIYLHESGPSEGWALYAETLGDYKDPYSRFGKLIHEMLRAVRLVVDTGIHYYGWSFEKSLQYLRSKTGMSYFDSQNEIRRYINYPGQAVTYKLGERYILSLRDAFLAGNKGTLKDFHSFLLDKGPIPFVFLD